MRWLADIAYLIVGLIYLPVAVYQALAQGKHRSGWRERFGNPNVKTSKRRNVETRIAPRIWVHAVSLGEINATPKLVEALRARQPDAEIVFSCTTDTGYRRATELYGADRVFRYPLDFSLVVNRVLDRIQPSLIVLVELEVWYNLVRLATKRAIPVAVVNGRLTARSARRLSRLGALVRPMFADLVWVGAQDETIAERFRRLGVAPSRIEVTSSMKWDTAAVADSVPGANELALAMGLGRSASVAEMAGGHDHRGVPVWVCGSTGPGEEELILTAYRRLLDCDDSKPGENGGRGLVGATEAARLCPALVLVPRKPERFDEVAGLVQRAGFVCARRSQRPDGSRVPRDLSAGSSTRPSAPPSPQPSPWEGEGASRSAGPVVFLGDTMGELRKFYCLADVVFVGRSLVPLGGSDPMEVAALGKPMLTGTHMENFEAPTRALREVGALQVAGTADELCEAVAELLRNPTEARAKGARGREVVLQNQGATDRTADRLVGLLSV